jgi:PAS domain-containing protein
VHRAAPDVGLPPAEAAGITLGADTEVLQKLARQLRLERAFLLTVLEQMPVGVCIAEAPSGRVILGNRRMEELMREPFYPALSIDQYDHWQSFRTDGQAYAPREVPLARALLFGEVVRGQVMRVRRVDGTDILLEVSAAPIHDEKGLIVAAVASFQDVSEHPWARQMFEGFLPPRPSKKKR